MTELNRRAVLNELDAIMHRAEPHLSSKGPVSTSAAQARHEMAHTLKTDIENGVYDVPGSTERDFYLTTLRVRWPDLTASQRKRLHRLDSLISIALRHLATDDRSIEEPEEEPLATPKVKSPWTWPLVALISLLVVVIGGTVTSLLMGGA